MRKHDGAAPAPTPRRRMRRRHFLKTVASGLIGGAAASAVSRTARAASAAGPTSKPSTRPGRFEIALLHTNVDWHLLWKPNPPLTWSPDSVKRVLDIHASGGNKTVYWRTMDGGKMMYPSKAGEVANGPRRGGERNYPDANLLKAYQACDYSQFDVLGIAVEHARRLGMRIVAWAEVYNEDHGLGPTDLLLEHPEWRRAYRHFKIPQPWGTWGQMSWAFPEVRAYKIGLLREMLQYGVDGIFLDIARGRDYVDNWGFIDSGYEAPTIDGYRKESGLDPWRIGNSEPTWIEYRSRVLATALREIRAMMKAFAGKEIVLYFAGINNPMQYVRADMNGDAGRVRSEPLHDEYTGGLVQVARWAREGLFDAICTHHWPWPKDSPYHLPPTERMKSQIDHYLPLVQGHARYLLEVYGFNYTREDLEQMLGIARESGCDGVVISEDGCFNGGNPTWTDLARYNARFGA